MKFQEMGFHPNSSQGWVWSKTTHLLPSEIVELMFGYCIHFPIDYIMSARRQMHMMQGLWNVSCISLRQSISEFNIHFDVKSQFDQN